MSELDQELESINRKVNRWRAFECFIFWVAGILLGWCVLTGLDMWLRPRFVGRYLFCALFLAAIVTGCFFLIRLMRHRRSPAAVAAFLEKRFPQLDNRLINCVLFDREPEKTPWLRTYLKEGVPGFDTLPLAEVKDRKARKWGGIAVVGFALLLAAPAFFLGDAWTVAMRRVANPFCRLSPPTFAVVKAVEPADATIVQGDGVDLIVKATGRAGQFVEVDLYPSDDKRATMRIGQFKETGVEEAFSYRVPKVAGTLDYRFTVGDAYPTDRYKISTVPPLALSTLDVVVIPPETTAMRARKFNALTNALTIPIHSRVEIRAVCNREATEVKAVFETGEIPFKKDSAGMAWSASREVTDGAFFTLAAKDKNGLDLRMPVRYQLLEDRLPSIRLITPSGAKASLPPNAAPVLRFEVTDEYGLGTVRIERVNKGARATAEGEVLKEWKMDGKKQMEETWKGELSDISVNSALRIVATDNAKWRTGERTVSPQIAFEMTTLSSEMVAEQKSREETRRSIGELVGRQRALLKQTQKLQGQLPGYNGDDWDGVRTKQTELRSYAQTLQTTRDAVIGTARVALGKALKGPINTAVVRLTRMSTAAAEQRVENAQGAVSAQEEVLKLLIRADENMERGEISQAAAGVLAMLDGIRKGQTANLNVTKKTAEGKAEKLADTVVERQDNLAQDVQAMIGFCRSEAKADRDDEQYSIMMTNLANRAESMRLHDEMIDIAEVMDSAEFAKSIRPQQAVTNNLAALMALLNEWREATTEEKKEESLATIKDAKKSLKKLEDLQAKIVEALRGTGSQGDKTEKLDEDLLEEIVELKKNMADSMLKVATDLQSLPELDAVNELVTDAFQTFEEMKQEEGSGTNAVVETGLQKEDFLLDMLTKTGQKADEMECFLFSTSDNVARNTENFDKEEMKAPIGQVTMPEELQDIVGDLLESEEEQMEKADDSVTNQGDANVDAGWGISEGEFVDYNASGKSGNDRPDHKDQDGRSQVGRQGMSDGEVMARSGKVNEGDKNLDKRRTQDSNQSGDVEEEGHSDAVATGGGKNSGYSQNRGMEGGEGSTRRDTKVTASEGATTRSQLTRNAEAAYAQAQLNNLKTYDLKRYIQFSRQIQMLEKQNASPAMIAELHKKAVKALTATYSSLENGVAAGDMGAVSATESDEEGVAASPDEAPAEYREMVSDYFKAIGEMQ